MTTPSSATSSGGRSIAAGIRNTHDVWNAVSRRRPHGVGVRDRGARCEDREGRASPESSPFRRAMSGIAAGERGDPDGENRSARRPRQRARPRRSPRRPCRSRADVARDRTHVSFAPIRAAARAAVPPLMENVTAPTGVLSSPIWGRSGQRDRIGRRTTEGPPERAFASIGSLRTTEAAASPARARS